MGEAASAAEPVVSKGEFAQLCNVTPGRVSQWISEGKLTGEALVGEGRAARVNVKVAQGQLKRGLDIGQRFGNGIQTRLEMAAPSAAPNTPPTPASPPADPYDEAMRAEKLREIQFRNRAAAEKELASRGSYVRTDDVRGAMGALAAGMLTVFEGSLTDLASAIAAKHQLPQRDVLHLLRTEFRTIRSKAAEVARKRAQGMTALIVDEVTDVAELPDQVAAQVD